MKRPFAAPPAVAASAALAALLLAAPSLEAGTPSPANAVLYIGWPTDGAVLPAGRPTRVWFGLRNMGVAPKGVALRNTGHHHLLIDTPLPPLDQEIPSDRNHLHFGAGETETTVELAPGKHTLQLLIGDEHHVPHDPPVVSKKVTVTVR